MLCEWICNNRLGDEASFRPGGMRIPIGRRSKSDELLRRWDCVPAQRLYVRFGMRVPYPGGSLCRMCCVHRLNPQPKKDLRCDTTCRRRRHNNGLFHRFVLYEEFRDREVLAIRCRARRTIGNRQCHGMHVCCGNRSSQSCKTTTIEICGAHPAICNCAWFATQIPTVN